MELATTLEYELTQILGEDGINTSPLIKDEVQRTTFSTEQKVIGVAYPRSSLEVSSLLAFCSQSSITVYPISRGCNWGLGSKVPLTTNSLLCDLSRMTAIERYDESLGTITVRPGTTFRQVSEYLKQAGGKHFLSVTGGAPDSSVLANTLERGDGLGPMGDRSRFASSLEIVLGDGRIIRTGFDNFGESSRIGTLTQDSLGPSFDGLFFQSNFGIVTEMTLWLHPVTEHFASVLFTLPAGDALGDTFEGIRELMALGVLRGNSLALWNMQKVIASAGNHPKRSTPELSHPLTDEELQRFLPGFFKGAYWFGSAALYGISKRHLGILIKECRDRLGQRAVKFLPMTRARAQLFSMFSPLMPRSKKEEMERWLHAFYYNSVYRGNPSELSIRSLYWRKPSGVPEHVDPNRDSCGLVWLCHAVPCSASEIAEAEALVREGARVGGFDPNVAFLFVSERYVRMFVALMYDRDLVGADAKVLECQKILAAQLNSKGYPPFRLGIQSMEQFKVDDKNYSGLLSKMKNIFDPHNTIAPGRYDGQYGRLCS